MSTELEVSRKVYSGLQGRALELLGDGIQASIVASTLGVTEAYISQLLAEEGFRDQVVEKRYHSLQKHNARDSQYDQIEDKLLDTLQKMLPMVLEPMKIAKILQMVNSAKRRGSSSPDSITTQNTVVQLTLPIQVTNRFRITKNADNQIIEAGDQSLVTVQSGVLLDRLKETASQNTEERANDATIRERVAAITAPRENPRTPSFSQGIPAIGSEGKTGLSQ